MKINKHLSKKIKSPYFFRIPNTTKSYNFKIDSLKEKTIMKTAFNLIKNKPANINFQPLKALLALTPFDLELDTDMMKDIIEELEYRAD